MMQGPSNLNVATYAPFALDFRTRVGSTNYLETDAAQNLNFAYGTQKNLLNAGRFSSGYFSTQLYRMRDAYDRYAQPGAASPSATDKVSSDPCRGSPEFMKKVQAQLPAVCESIPFGENP